MRRSRDPGGGHLHSSPAPASAVVRGGRDPAHLTQYIRMHVYTNIRIRVDVIQCGSIVVQCVGDIQIVALIA